jgi:hypothetical protein
MAVCTYIFSGWFLVGECAEDTFCKRKMICSVHGPQATDHVYCPKCGEQLMEKLEPYPEKKSIAQIFFDEHDPAICSKEEYDWVNKNFSLIVETDDKEYLSYRDFGRNEDLSHSSCVVLDHETGDCPFSQDDVYKLMRIAGYPSVEIKNGTVVYER